MIRVYSMFSLAMNDIPFTEGKIYFFPAFNGTFGGTWGMSALLPVVFVKEDY